MLTEAGLRSYAERKAQVAGWLTEQRIPHYVPPALASDLYADASHPTAAGYDALARSLVGQSAFQDYCRR
jgi:hypothetical protein